ncbi:flagellar basal body-associated FliL family protein [Aquabacter spiritensis]|uniref:Flagellar protein FliL n=1 Tax=Aquabacter spiritensis TaxID=933073 RepID=A0A4R3M4Y2_9HYPH|nr:flagellar basal body-associated FliL family protein [Aquabacter spiritensis]TCT07926.1 flagellar FliL protein [Aquabacter spiritensis]
MAKPAPKAAAPAAGGAKKSGGLFLALAILTLLAAATGGGIGVQLASTVKQVVVDQAKAAPAQIEAPQLRYSGDLILEPLKPVLANLAAPASTWVRIEGAIVFKNGALPNPQVAAAEIREDILTYVRTLTLSQLEGPSALQNLREDMTERAKLRTEGKLTELIIETLVVQ